MMTLVFKRDGYQSISVADKINYKIQDVTKCQRQYLCYLKVGFLIKRVMGTTPRIANIDIPAEKAAK
jgi:hypothetical protein